MAIHLAFHERTTLTVECGRNDVKCVMRLQPGMHTAVRLCRMMRCRCTRSSCQRSLACVDACALRHRLRATVSGASSGSGGDRFAGLDVKNAMVLRASAAVSGLAAAVVPPPALLVALAADGSESLVAEAAVLLENMRDCSTSTTVGRSPGASLSRS